MPLPNAAVTDVQRSVAALARRSGLVFHLLPARKASDPPWLIVDQARAIGPRYAAANKQLAALGFVRRGEASGRLLVVGSALVFVLDDAPEGFETRLRGLWASAYVAEPDKAVKRLGVLLKGARTVSEEEAVTFEAQAPAEDPAGDLGDDAPVAREVLGKASLWKRALAVLPRPKRGKNVEAEKLRGLVRETPAHRLPELVPTFLRATLSGLPGDDTPLTEGTRPSPEDENLALAAAVSAWERALVAWEERVAAAEGLLTACDASEAALARGGDDAAKDAHTALLARYTVARLASERAEVLAETLGGKAEALHGAARA